MKKGDLVCTSWGDGKVVHFRETDGFYVVELPFATLYTTDVTERTEDYRSMSSPMELNVAYEALEKMRKFNLEVQCQERGLSYFDYEHCTKCLLDGKYEPAKPPAHLKSFPRLQKLHSKATEFSNDRKKTSNNPCLICGSPVCNVHSSETFRKEKITLCLECEKLFSPEYVIKCMTVSSEKERQGLIDVMIDSYDRSCLLLKYAAQFSNQVADSLDKNTQRQNKIGLGSSSAGIVSGALGIAAAATILTPAGPPLLIASLLFGGSATAVQTGAEVHNYYSEPNQFADRVIALHGLVLSILRIVGTLRDALLRDYIRGDHYLEKTLSDQSMHDVYRRNRGTAMAAMTIGRYGMAGMELGQIATAAEVGVSASRSARFFSRASSGMMRSLRFARFAGGALSAATILLEANMMTKTINDIKKGSPNEKAQQIREINESLSSLPTSADIDRECESYVTALRRRRRLMTEDEAIRLIMEQTNILEDQDGQLILEEVPDEEISTNNITDASITGQTIENGQTNMSASLISRIKMFKKQEQSPGPVDSDIPGESESNGKPQNLSLAEVGQPEPEIEVKDPFEYEPAGQSESPKD